jgi:hypothetical protein
MQTKWRAFLTKAILQVVVCLMLILGGALAFGLGDTIGPPVEAQSGWTNFSNVRVGSHLATSVKTTRVLTNDGTLNPLGTLQPISSTAAVGTSGANITVEPAGTLLILRNVGANTITFTETGTLISAGNIALGANDSATLISDGTNWVQIAASNN